MRDKDIPKVIPEVTFDGDEPVIAKTMVVSPSPIPRSVTILLIMLSVFSVGYIVWQQEQRDADIQAQEYRDRAFIAQLQQQQGFLEDQQEVLERQQDIADRERIALRTLVLSLVAADTPEERRQLLLDFAQDRDNGQNGEPAPTPSPTPSGASAPAPGPTPSPSRPPPNPSPRPSTSPTPQQVPTPVPLPVSICISTPLGEVCV